MFEAIILGLVQGITEWLPVSSSAMLVLLQKNFFYTESVLKMVEFALFLHLGTFFATLVYFWKDIWNLLKEFFSFGKQDKEIQNKIIFYFIASFVSLLVAFLIYVSLKGLGEVVFVPSALINVVIALLLFITAFMQLRKKSGGKRSEKSLTRKDALLVGVGQGLAALPGVSRSGTTTSLMLLRGFNEYTSLYVSFILSVPIVLFGNIFLNLDSGIINQVNLVGLLTSFVSGLLFIHLFLKIAKRVNFGWFVFVFACLVLVSVFI